MDNGARMMGCWNGLGKRAAAGLDFGDDAQPAKRAVAFSNAIRQSKQFTEYFPQVIEACINAALDGLRSAVVGIDGHPAAGRLAPAAWAFAARDVTSELLTITPKPKTRWDLHWWGGENRLVRCRLVHPLVLAAWSGIVA